MGLDMKFGHAIKQQRLLKGRTLDEVADAIGTGKPYLSQIENIRTVPSPEMVVSLTKELGLYPKDFLLMVAREKIEQMKLDILYKYTIVPDVCPCDTKCVHWDYGCYYSSECIHEKLGKAQ